MTENNNSFVSIITVSYNAVDTIEATICSIINQTYSNIEYIVIDGGSTDGTVDIIKKYADKISYWISEPDRGIYDAMNKGTDVATGVWINFMNCGDAFYSSETLKKVMEEENKSADVVYGDTMLKYAWGTIEKKALPPTTMQDSISFSHQSCLIKTDIMRELKYNLEYRICADYHLFHQIYLRGGRFYYLPMCISVYEAEQGISSINWLDLERERGRIRGEEESYSWRIRFFFLKYSYLWGSLIKNMIPHNWLAAYYRKRFCS